MDLVHVMPTYRVPCDFFESAQRERLGRDRILGFEGLHYIRSLGVEFEVCRGPRLLSTTDCLVRSSRLQG